MAKADYTDFIDNTATLTAGAGQTLHTSWRDAPWDVSGKRIGIYTGHNESDGSTTNSYMEGDDGFAVFTLLQSINSSYDVALPTAAQITSPSRLRFGQAIDVDGIWLKGTEATDDPGCYLTGSGGGNNYFRNVTFELTGTTQQLFLQCSKPNIIWENLHIVLPENYAGPLFAQNSQNARIIGLTFTNPTTWGTTPDLFADNSANGLVIINPDFTGWPSDARLCGALRVHDHRFHGAKLSVNTDFPYTGGDDFSIFDIWTGASSGTARNAHTVRMSGGDAAELRASTTCYRDSGWTNHGTAMSLEWLGGDYAYKENHLIMQKIRAMVGGTFSRSVRVTMHVLSDVALDAGNVGFDVIYQGEATGPHITYANTRPTFIDLYAGNDAALATDSATWSGSTAGMTAYKVEKDLTLYADGLEFLIWVGRENVTAGNMFICPQLTFTDL